MPIFHKEDIKLDQQWYKVQECDARGDAMKNFSRAHK